MQFHHNSMRFHHHVAGFEIKISVLHNFVIITKSVKSLIKKPKNWHSASGNQPNSQMLRV